MKNPIEHLNRIFDSRIRLGIMSAVLVNSEVNFNELKELIQVTDGNLASHLKTLEENQYIKVKKGFIGRKTNTTYAVTRSGEKAFKAHLEALEQISAGNLQAGPIAALDPASRFRWLTAKRSTVVQTSKVHPGLSLDVDQTLEKLFNEQVL